MNFRNLFFKDASLDGSLKVFGVHKMALAVVSTPDGDINFKLFTGSRHMINFQAASHATWLLKRAVAALSTHRLYEIYGQVRVSIQTLNEHNEWRVAQERKTVLDVIQLELDFRKKHGDKPISTLKRK